MNFGVGLIIYLFRKMNRNDTFYTPNSPKKYKYQILTQRIL